MASYRYHEDSLKALFLSLFQEFFSPGNDPIYFQDLAVELLHSLERLKREMETKHHLKAYILCHFGTVFIDQPDEGIILIFASNTCKGIGKHRADTWM